METMRGFSYMPTLKNESKEMKLIEEEELESAWKSSRRERQKHQEERLWREFIEEKDLLQSAMRDDPYQFLQQLPEDKIKELLAIELADMKRQHAELNRQQELLQHPEQEVLQQETPAPVVPESHVSVPVITFTEAEDVPDEQEKEENNHVLQIFGEDDDGIAGGDNDQESVDSAPATVREVDIREAQSISSNNCSSKSSENMSNILESSIYCARIKELRARLSEEMVAVGTTIDCQNISILDREDILKTLKRSTEYASRYNRIHLYNLQRQTEYIKRQNQSALPFAKYTQFQAQIIRIVALHQNMLQALQVFHKSLEQTHGVPPAAELVRALAACARDATLVCRAVRVPRHCDQLARTLFNDDMLSYCDRLSTTAQEYSAGVTSYLQHAETMNSARSQKMKKLDKKYIGSGRKPDVSGKLSMYASADKLLSKHGSAKDLNSVTSRYRKVQPVPKEPKPPSPKSTTKIQQPRMRAPKTNLHRPKRYKESEIATLVEMCGSPSPGPSPAPSPRAPAPHTDRDGTSDAVPVAHDGHTPAPTPREKVACSDDVKYDVTQLVRHLCGGDSHNTSKDERGAGARNAQLLCLKSSSPRANTPQLLRILEENIQKKPPAGSPRAGGAGGGAGGAGRRDRLHMALTVQEDLAARIFQYRRQFVQHMLTSPMYANYSVGRPWDVVSSVAEHLIDEMLQRCAQEMEIRPVVNEMYRLETRAAT